MRLATGLAALTLSMCFLAVQPAAADDQKALRWCARAAAYGPLKKDITIAGHDFNCHPIRAAKEAEIIAARKPVNAQNSYYKGQLSHRLRLRPDDQVEYIIQLYTGRVGGGCVLLPPTIKINRGGFINIAKPVTDMFGVRESDWRSVAKKLEGDWEATASLIVLTSVTKWAEQFPHCAKQNW